MYQLIKCLQWIQTSSRKQCRAPMNAHALQIPHKPPVYQLHPANVTETVKTYLFPFPTVRAVHRNYHILQDHWLDKYSHFLLKVCFASWESTVPPSHPSFSSPSDLLPSSIPWKVKFPKSQKYFVVWFNTVHSSIWPLNGKTQVLLKV